MLRSNSKSLGNHVVRPEAEKERLQWEGFAEKEGFRPPQVWNERESGRWKTNVVTVVSNRYDTRCYFNMRSKADISPLNLPHGQVVLKRVHDNVTDIVRKFHPQTNSNHYHTCRG